MGISHYIIERDITEVLHFTTVRGLTGCAASSSVLSRKALDKSKYLSHIASPVSKERKEAQDTFNKDEDWIDFINLSISEINSHYYRAAKRWFREVDTWWCILAFSPEILTHEGVYFTTTNNIYSSVKRIAGQQGLENLFTPSILRWNGNIITRGTRTSQLTTCEQAEVLYPNPLSMDYLRKVYVQNSEQAASVYGTLRSLGFTSVDVNIQAEKFNGVPNPS